MAQQNIIPEPSVFVPAISAAAFQKILPEIMALSDDDTQTVMLDVVAAATTVLGLVPTLKALRPQIVGELPRFNIQRFDELEHYAHALIHAHALHRGAQMPKGQIAQLGNDLIVIRDRMYGNAMSLSDNGLLDGSRLKDCKTAVGYRATATDVLTLVEVFKEYWSNIEGKTPMTPELLFDAANRAGELLTAVGLRAQASETVGERAQMRAKAYTLFLRAYEDARHAVEFLRRDHDDAAEVAPSLFAGRGGRRRADDTDPPEPTAATSAAGAAGKKPSRSDSPPPIVIENPEGLPLDSPFTS